MSIRGVFEFPAVHTNYLLCVLKTVLELRYLCAYVIAGGTVAERDVFVEANKASRVSEVAAQNMANRLVKIHQLFVIIDSKHRRNIVSSAVVEG